jgi:hypothetical protein
MVAAMHAENQLYLSRAVLAFALGCDVDELERKALLPLRREAMLDSGDAYVLTRHRRIAEAACDIMREDEDDIDRWYPFLARAAQLDFKKNYSRDPNIQSWNTGLANYFVEKAELRWSVARAVAKAVSDSAPDNGLLLTAYSSVLRRTGRAQEAFSALKATGDRFRNDRAVLYEWSAAAGAIGDHHLSVWLAGRSLADGGTLAARQCRLSLAGLGVAFRELFSTSHDVTFAAAHAACGHLGLRLPNLDLTGLNYFERYAAEGHRHGIADLAPEEAINAIRRAVIVGGNEVEPDRDLIFFERLLCEPEGYRFTALLQVIRGESP